MIIPKAKFTFPWFKLSPNEDISLQYKRQLSVLSDQIMTNPQQNISKLQCIIEMLDVANNDLKYGLNFYFIQKNTFLVLNLTFMNIIPNYKIRQNGDANSGQMKKETKEIMEYEQKMLKLYQDFIKRTRRLILASLDMKDDSDFYQHMFTEQEHETLMKLALVACRCISDLLVAHSDFNYSEELVDILARIHCSKKTSIEMKRTVFVSLINIFRKDVLGETSAQIVKGFCERMIQLQFQVEPNTLNIFSHIIFSKIKPNNAGPNESENQMFPQAEGRLLENEATMNEEIRAKNERIIHSQLYSFYWNFISIVDDHLILPNENLNIYHRPLLPIILNGIIHLSMYSNEDSTFCWIRRLKSIIENQYFDISFKQTDRLIFLKNIFILVTTLKNVEKYDSQCLYYMLYQTSFDKGNFSASDFRSFLECANLMIVNNTNISSTRLFNFIFKFISMINELNGAEAIALLLIIKKCLELPRNEFILENDDEFDDSSCNNALPISNWEFILPNNPDVETNQMMKDIKIQMKIISQKHFNPYVCLFAKLWYLNKNTHPAYNSVGTFYDILKQNRSLDTKLCCVIFNSTNAVYLYEQIVDANMDHKSESRDHF